jgi:hypothetical protein
MPLAEPMLPRILGIVIVNDDHDYIVELRDPQPANTQDHCGLIRGFGRLLTHKMISGKHSIYVIS